MEETPGRGYRVYKALEQEHGVCAGIYKHVRYREG